MNFFLLIQRFKLLTLMMLAVIILSVILVLMYFLGAKTQPKPILQTETVPQPSAQSEILFQIPQSSAKYFAPFVKTNINQQLDEDISTAPTFKKSAALSKGQTQYLFSSPYLSRDNEVITRNGVAIFKRLVVVSDDPSFKTDISSYKEKYGTPEAEFIGSAYYGDSVQTYIWTSKGLAIIFYPYTGEVLEIQSFSPMSKEEYKMLWGADITTYKKIEGP